MSVLRGHEDLHPKAIVGFDMGFALVQCGEDIQRYRMEIGPSGALTARPEPVRKVTPLDQEVGPSPAPQQQQEERARRHAGIDQPIYSD